MNPKDTPVKFPKGTRVKSTSGPSAGLIGTIEEERQDGFNNKVVFDSGKALWFSDYQLEAVLVPEVGDLVRVKATGRWQAHEGHIVFENIGTFTVDFGYEEKAVFGAPALEVIEKVKPLPVRIEGQPIKPEDIKRGDTISVVTTTDNSAEDIKLTTIVEATVDKIIPKFSGTVLHFQTRSGTTIPTSDKSVISLVKSIDNDAEYQTLKEAKTGDIIGFPDEEGGVETNLAVKQGEDFWSVMLGTKKSKTVETVGLVNILRKKNVTYSVIRTAKAEFEFPVGTHVKVSPTYSDSLSQGDYRVVIAGETESTVKSRGISASTFIIPNRYLTKGVS